MAYRKLIVLVSIYRHAFAHGEPYILPAIRFWENSIYLGENSHSAAAEDVAVGGKLSENSYRSAFGCQKVLPSTLLLSARRKALRKYYMFEEELKITADLSRTYGQTRTSAG